MLHSTTKSGREGRRLNRAAHLLLAIFGLMLICAPGAAAQEKIPFKRSDTIEQLRDKIKANGYNFTVGHTRLFDMPAEQRAKIIRPRIAPPPQERIIAPHSDEFLRTTAGTQSLPARFDWRNVNGHSYVGPIHDQGNLGSCYAFGATSAAETTYNVSKGLYDGNVVDFAEMYIIWTLSSVNPYKDHFYGDEGADMDYYELYALTASGPPQGAVGFEGIIDEAHFPYSDSTTPPSVATINNSKTWPRKTFKEWKRVYPANYADTTQQMKIAIYTYGAIDAAIQTDPGFDAYTGGIYENDVTQPDQTTYYYSTTDHAISLVGWDDDPNNDGNTSDGCWILRNSYGDTEWGDKGYMLIKYFCAMVNTSAAYLVPEDGASTTTTINIHTSTTTTAWDEGEDESCLAEEILGRDNPGPDQLRAFRDQTLARTALGRACIHLYYQNTAGITAVLKRNPLLRDMARRVLTAVLPGNE